MHLDPHHIHIWSIDLSITPVQEKNLLALLSADENERVHRIRLSTHKQRSIAARGYLRRILAMYLNQTPDAIEFAYTKHHKPFLADQSHDLQFNLAHSHDHALLALTLRHPIGVDIEKIGDSHNPQVAKRYFSVDENIELEKLPINEQNHAFYHIWSRKEAIVKAIGLGLSLPLSSFTVAANDSAETIVLHDQDWSLASLAFIPGFASAVASAQTIKAISYWRLTADGYTMIR